MVRKVILRYERTPYAKQIRKDYERGDIKERRTDGCTNTVTTVQKDNYLLEWNDGEA